MKKKILIVGCADIGLMSALTLAISSKTNCEAVVVSPEEVDFEEENKELKLELKNYSYLPPEEDVKVIENKHPFDKFINGKRNSKKWKK